jgi:2,3-bisphosphoglycerate-dependent phosphoglycerate mutase
MAAMTELILVRHGETDWNRELRFQGHVDVALNAIGHEQARRVAARLAGEPARHLYVSDLIRAQQTAHPVAQQLQLHGIVEPALREQSFGDVDGMRVDDIKAQHPQAWEAWLRFHEDDCMPGGETMREFHARVMAAVRRIAADHRDATVVIVTHGGVLDMIYRTARSLPLGGPRQSQIPNAGVSRVAVRDTAFEILSWADTSHLADLPPQPVYEQRKPAADDDRRVT